MYTKQVITTRNCTLSTTDDDYWMEANKHDRRTVEVALYHSLDLLIIL